MNFFDLKFPFDLNFIPKGFPECFTFLKSMALCKSGATYFWAAMSHSRTAHVNRVTFSARDSSL